MGFDEEFENFLMEQKKAATGQRAEMLNRGLAGTKLLVKNVLLPVFGKFDGMMLEFELKVPSGVSIFGDVGLPAIRTVVEEDNFITHAEKITRDRFSFERARARSLAVLGFVYFPYSRDELEKNPEVCQLNLYELLGKIGTKEGTGIMRLPVYEREVLRCAMLRSGSFQVNDVCEWLLLRKEASRNVLRELEAKSLICRVGGGTVRCFEFQISEKAKRLLLQLI